MATLTVSHDKFDHLNQLNLVISFVVCEEEIFLIKNILGRDSLSDETISTEFLSELLGSI